VSKDFSYSSDMNPQVISIPNPQVSSLEFTSPDEIVKYNKRNRIISLNLNSVFGINGEDTLYLNNVHFRITKSPNDSFQISMIKLSEGKSRKEAAELASEINYQIMQEDSLIRMPFGIPFSKDNIFRNQHVIVTVAVPVGKKIKINQSIWNAPNGKINFSFNNDDWNDYWGDEEHGWTTNVQYIMKPDGLYEMNGEPVDKSKNGYQQKKETPETPAAPVHKTNKQDDDDNEL
jgi:phage shock protein C